MKKHGLFKILSLMVVVLVLLSWFIPASYYSGSEMVDLGLYRIGVYEFFNYPILSVQYFVLTIVFILIVGAFYGVLGETGKYRTMVEKFAAKLKGKEKIFFIATAFLLAGLQSVFGYGILLFMFIPFICSVVIELGYNKFTALLVSFIPILIGTIGSTLDPNIVLQLSNITSYEASIYPRIALFVICFVVYLLFLLEYIKKHKKDKKDSEKEEDLFIGEKKNNKKHVWPIIVFFGIIFVLLVLGSTKWVDVFGVNLFANLHTTVTTWAIGESYTVVAYVLGGFLAFGTWTMTDYIILLVMTMLVMKFVYKIKFDEMLEAACKGAIKLLKPAMLIILVYVIVIITAYHPFYATVAAWITDWTSSFNVITSSLVTILGSVFNVEMLYLSQSSIPYMVSLFTSDAALNSLTIVTQSMYGLTMCVAPTSLILLLGLEYLNIPYTKWLKSSWKFIVELLIVILGIIIVVALI